MHRLLILAALAGLAACTEQPKESGTERRTAAGELLGGEIGDAMLPLDTVRSTSPSETSAAVDDARAIGPATPRVRQLEEPEPGAVLTTGADPAESDAGPSAPEQTPDQ